VVAVCHAGIVEASFALGFGLGASGRRVDCAPRNTSLPHWRHRVARTGEAEWTLSSSNDAGHLTGSSPPASPARDAVPIRSEGAAVDR
jgi:hypothetical protein